MLDDRVAIEFFMKTFLNGEIYNIIPVGEMGQKLAI
ncbi:MAG: hypothetical protein H6Q68_2554 [Firmicutes bacterium]|nr:hypothetical protein [Bacillota bacterium]